MKDERKRLVISTLSPIHVGCGEAYEPSQFVIVNSVLHLFDSETLMLALDEHDRQQLIALTKQHDPIGPLQKFFKARRERLAPLASQLIDVAPDIAKEYEEKAGQVQQRGASGAPVYNLFPMARTAYNALDGSAYLPGSSLKGAMRTAWLSRLNQGKALQPDERNDARKLEQRLLGYRPGQFHNDPFRHVRVTDAHHDPEDLPPATRILYAVSKKKRPSERSSPELKVFLEAVREAQSSAFVGELQLTSNTIAWNALCDACNNFYWPKFEAELRHAHLASMLATEWRKLILKLLEGELGELRKARQGFLLRVGHHSGAESLTLDGVRSIKILGAKGQQPSYRPETTEKRFASLSRAAQTGLMPFGWLWVDAADDDHQHLAIEAANALRRFAKPMREAHRARIEAAEERKEARARAAAQRAQRMAEAAAAEKAEAEAQAAREAQRAAMTENQRRVADFENFCRQRHEQLRGGKEKANAQIHQKARELAKAAHEGADWSAEEKRAVAAAIEEWLPKLVSIDIKDERKKLKLAALRGQQ